MKKILFFLLFFSLHAQNIHVICTSALIEKEFARRQMEYMRGITQLRHLGFEPWIIEATNIDHSFFDEVTSQVLYPNQNNLALRNKGVNELASIRACFDRLPFADDDIVIKITGRYYLRGSYFIDEIKKTRDAFDVWGNFGQHFVDPGHLFTGCFAMRWKWFKEVINSIDLVMAEVDYIAIEKLIAEEIERRGLRVNRLPSLHLEARIFYSGWDAQNLHF